MSISAWEGTLDGTTDGPVCPQLNIATNQVIGKEDCLVLNVYTPDVRFRDLISNHINYKPFRMGITKCDFIEHVRTFILI